jgi:hypothetical protein
MNLLTSPGVSKSCDQVSKCLIKYKCPSRHHMSTQKVPDLLFDDFVLGEIDELFQNGKIHINSDYQRGDIWTHRQQVELIESIKNRYSIGVLVLFINDQRQYEILDGQQRLLTVKKYGHQFKETQILCRKSGSPKPRIELFINGFEAA